MSALAPRAKYPTFSFPDPGTKAHGVITQPPEDSQVRKFGTDTLEFWPDGNPIMQTRIVLRDNTDTEYAVYAKGRMAKAITSAIIEAGADDLEVGGELSVEFTQYGTPKTPGGKPPKLYEATYIKPTVSAADHADQDDDEPPF
jgi:hypothetical protein